MSDEIATSGELPVIIDANKRKWRLIITVGIYVKLRDEHGIDLLDEKSISNVLMDPVQRSEVLLAILDRQASKLGLTPDDVDELLCDPETSPPAHVALEAALRDFYKTQSAMPMALVLDRVSAAAKILTNTAMDRINSDQMTKMIQKEVEKATRMMDQTLSEMEAKQIGDDGLTS